MRYQVMNLGHQMGVSKGSSSPSYATLCQYAKAFKDAVDNSRGADNINVASQAYNNAFDGAVRNNESFYDILVALETDCGIPWAYLTSLRPNGLVNPFTNEYFGPAGYEPPGTHRGPTATPGGHDPYKPQGVKERPSTVQPVKPLPPPVISTDQRQQAQPPSTPSQYEGLMTPSEVRDEALRRHLEWMKRAGISAEYAPVATEGAGVQQPQQPQEPQQPSKPKAVLQPPPTNVASVDCRHLGPNAFWDGRQCRSGDMTAAAGGFGGLMNVASMAPAASAVAFGMGGRFPVVNL